MKGNLIITILIGVLNILFYVTGGAASAFDVHFLFGVAMCLLLLAPFGAYIYFTFNSK